MRDAIRPMIYDTMIFFMELDMLELRLQAHWDHVDRFVVVEATWDFTGREKPLYFEESRARFAPYMDKITYIPVTETPPNAEIPWERHFYQRDQILRGTGEAAPDDVIMVSDLDEILRPEAIEKGVGHLRQRRCLVATTMDNHAYRLNLRVGDGRPFPTTRMVRARDFHRPRRIRAVKRAYWGSMPRWADQIPARYHIWRATGWPWPRVMVRDAGWHMSYVGGRDILRAKFESFIEDEKLHGQTRYDELLGDALDAGQIAEHLGMIKVDVDTLPEPVRRDPEAWAHLLA